MVMAFFRLTTAEKKNIINKMWHDVNYGDAHKNGSTEAHYMQQLYFHRSALNDNR